MKLKNLAVPLAFSLPFWIGLLLDFMLNVLEFTENVLVIQIRIDPGTLALIIGSTISILLLGVWAYRRSRIIRSQRQLQHVQSEAAQLRKRFVSQLDHELKNPLTALRAEIAYLTEDVDPQDFEKTILDMSTQVDRLGRLVSDLRKLAELEDLEIQRSSVNIAELLEEIYEAVQGHPGYSDRTVKLLLLQDPWPLAPIQGDRGLLWLACYNLVDNALKFAPAGSAIELRAYESGGWMVIEVIDNGPGISPEDEPHIFEELYRGTNARGFPGSGLGLALVKAIIIKHDGSISVRSRPDQGTVFTIHLPKSD